MKNKNVLIILVIGALLLLCIYCIATGLLGSFSDGFQEGVSESNTKTDNSQVSITPTDSEVAEPEVNNDSKDQEETSALEMMEVAFEGGYSQSEIKEKLDEAMTLYALEINEENYSKAGSALIALRKESKTGVTEMDILDFMIEMYAEDVNMSFPDAAGLAAGMLE
ncbi:hypothetical protein JW796_01630 [Candidatus Dojkabacteria bacterium]|nr:hypothetical protein [Candidatus Dojkabacteria bacterium]